MSRNSRMSANVGGLSTDNEILLLLCNINNNTGFFCPAVAKFIPKSGLRSNNSFLTYPQNIASTNPFNIIIRSSLICFSICFLFISVGIQPLLIIGLVQYRVERQIR